MKRAIVRRKFGRVVVAALLCGPFLARAQDHDNATPAGEKGILPIPNYGGDLLNRSHLFGDLGGTRTELARKGIQFQADWVQTVQSVVDGGRDTGTKYGGSMDYDIALDLSRMGVLPGALLKVRAESRYGESVNDMTGSILPANADAFFPLHTPLDDCVPIAVTNVTYFQFLSKQLAVFAGKFDALDSDLNEFASGRGKSQFMNIQLIFSASLSLLPYSTVGGGVIVMPTKNMTVKSVVFSLTDSSTTTGLDDCDGWVSATEAAFQYRLGTLPGGANVGGIYIWNSSFFDFNERFIFEPGQGFVPPTTSDTWIAYFSGWQYICTETAPPDHPLHLENGEPDLQGVGVFWRASVADDDVNPAKWTVSGGIGGKGIIPGRDEDVFGVGYFYNEAQTTRLTNALGLQDHTQGFECFYNVQLTPAVQLTFDAQLIDPARSELDTAVLLGARLRFQF